MFEILEYFLVTVKRSFFSIKLKIMYKYLKIVKHQEAFTKSCKYCIVS